MELISIFFLVASITLIQLVWTDLKAKETDLRLSYYMYGVLSFIFLYLNQVLLYIAFLVIVTVGLQLIKERINQYLGEGDISILAWLLPGLFVINPLLGLMFCLFYGMSLGFMFLFFKKKILPGTIPMFLGLMIVWFIQLAKLI